MSEELLKQILVEIKDVKFELIQVKSNVDVNTRMLATLNELKEIPLSLDDRQEDMDARLESLAMDVHKMQEEVIVIKKQISEIRSELEFTFQKTVKNEMELFKLRREFS
ncbi:hypothetical protein MKY41_04550 [Sporosarcina sp. FSL W7-1349]|uniref:hypothetical protein n=1 Tax=Sporosarcina sp. FSL W7-1349 TaxID=2921561 RepID=UPI0030F839FC